MGFSSVDDLVNEITVNGKFKRAQFQKTNSAGATSAAGRWHSMFTWNGIPTAGSYTGTAGVATVLNSSSTGALDIGTAVSPDTRHLLSTQVVTPSTVITPATLILCDFLLYYPSCVVTGSPTALNNTATIPRYTDGVGVMAMIEVQTALGAASPALTLNYRDQSDNDAAATLALTSPANSAPISTMFAYSGTPFMPLLAGDTGVKRINSYTLASGTTGTVSMVLVKPLAEIPLLAANTATERDYLSQLPALPQIQDGACLGFIVLIGGAMTTLQSVVGKVEMGWG